jgi:spoIIIJ-associated protein
MEFMEFEGKTTEEAIESAVAHFQLPAEQLEIEIVSVGSPGIFGLGGKKAKIKAGLPGEGDDDLLPLARETLEQVLGYLDESATVAAVPEEDRISLLIETSDAGLLIGKQGQTLDALQYLVTKMLSKQTRRKVRIAIDVESYRARHNEALSLLAKKSGEKVRRSGKSVTLNPMNPYDRRIVHMALQGDKDLKTVSRGEGLYKKVVISPAKKSKGQEDAAGPA